MNVPVQSYLEKWEARDPAQRVLRAFLPVSLQQILPLWLELLNELDETMFETSDAAVTRTKLAWWGEELSAGGARSRHPLVKALLAAPAGQLPPSSCWQALCVAAQRLADEDARASDWNALAQRWQGLATRVAEIESTLVGHDLAPQVIAAQWWAARAMRATRRAGEPGLALPLSAWTQAPGLSPAAFEAAKAAPLWAELAEQHRRAHAGSVAAGSAQRRLQARLDRLRLQRLAAGQSLDQAWPVSPLRGLWWSWQSARRAGAA